MKTQHSQKKKKKTTKKLDGMWKWIQIYTAHKLYITDSCVLLSLPGFALFHVNQHEKNILSGNPDSWILSKSENPHIQGFHPHKPTCSCVVVHVLSTFWSLYLSLKCSLHVYRASLVAQMAKNLPEVQQTWLWPLGQEDPLEKEMVTHSSIPAWRISWTEA